MGAYLRVTGEYQCLSGELGVELAENDEIQLVIKADGVGDVVTLNHFTTTISPAFS